MALRENQVVTGEVRLSYANLFKARAMNEGETPKYGSMILIPKKDKATVARFNEAQEFAKQEGKNKFGGKVPANLKTPLRDGDEEYPDDPNFAGMWFFNASNQRRPIVVDRSKSPLTEDDDEIYSGVYGKVVVNLFAYAGKSKGIAAGFEAFQKTRDGERLGGGGIDIDDAFGDEDDI
jgi:hypothetical protein